MVLRTRTCNLCGATIKQNVAAHRCPHGRACRYLTGDHGMPVDWTSPECPDCRTSGAKLQAVPSFGLTDKARDELD
ncbi:MAG: hypothetical protein KC731_33560 [Myxococcales bacterium]|nr:hypothetical protein [Myxococcales bacterium]